MERDRRRVFQLLMLGRITPAEAERLMAVWQASRECSWILIGCIGIGLLAVLHLGALPVVQHLVHAARVSGLMHGVVELVVRWETCLRG
jgi:hypothetical protein